MAEFLLADKISGALSKAELVNLYKEYKKYLVMRPFPDIEEHSYQAYLHFLKREHSPIGPYTEITVFEAANRIATDLALFEGVLKLYMAGTIEPDATVRLRLGTMQSDGKGDFSVFQTNGETQGEVFDVAPSFFKVKLGKTLRKWKGDASLAYIVFNKDAVDEKSRSWYEKQKTENRNISFVEVQSWHKVAG
jgi:hypothetical protein